MDCDDLVETVRAPLTRGRGGVRDAMRSAPPLTDGRPGDDMLMSRDEGRYKKSYASDESE